MELIDFAEKDRLFQKAEARLLYTRKAEVYGCCIKLLTDLEYVTDRWDDNFYLTREPPSVVEWKQSLASLPG